MEKDIWKLITETKMLHPVSQLIDARVDVGQSFEVEIASSVSTSGYDEV